MRFGRKAAQEPADGDDAVVAEVESRIEGPHDADGLELEDDPAFANHIDLGGLVLAPPPAGVELRLQVDEESETVLAVLLATERGHEYAKQILMLPRQIAHEMVVAASVGKYLWGLPESWLRTSAAGRNNRRHREPAVR